MDRTSHRELALQITGISALLPARPRAAKADPSAGPATPQASPSLLTGNVIALPRPEAATPVHETMLEMLHEARRRGMSHTKDSLPACELMLEIHAPAGELLGMPCAACREPWPCTTVLGILGGLEPAL
jgi:hypothetical protein